VRASGNGAELPTDLVDNLLAEQPAADSSTLDDTTPVDATLDNSIADVFGPDAFGTDDLSPDDRTPETPLVNAASDSASTQDRLDPPSARDATPDTTSDKPLAVGPAPSPSPAPSRERSVAASERSPAASSESPPVASRTAKRVPTQESAAAAVAATATPGSATPAGRTVAYFDGAIKYGVGTFPIMGNPDAPHVLVKYFDYTCAACKRMHQDLDLLIERFPDQVAVIVLPCPLDHACNPHAEKYAGPLRDPHQGACEIAKVALAVWRENPQEFVKFHNQLFKVQSNLTPAGVKLVAKSMAGEAVLSRLENDAWIDQAIAHAASVYGQLKKTNPRMPKLLLGERQILHGVVVDQQEFLRVMQQQLKLKPGVHR
jgi:protein-disulfide isomerase